jgi:3-carboxy-cis,cis-muconate cycloisomerase
MADRPLERGLAQSPLAGVMEALAREHLMADPHPNDVSSLSQLSVPLYASTPMRATMTDRARLQRMLDFEAALARAEAAVGVIPAGAARAIGDACDASRYDIPALIEASIPTGHISIAMVNALTAEVLKREGTAANYVHWGATSQDVTDTALMLELRAAIDALLADLDVAIKGFTALTGKHRRTLGVARTLLQQALPMPFGLKVASYAAALARSRDRLMRLRREALVLQFGGAAGTLAALGENGLPVSERLAAVLDLSLPDAPWHTHRDRLAEIAAAFAILAGTCGKIARDVALMMQIEVGEAFEPAASGRGASSTIPQKRNPVLAATALSAATVAPNLVATLFAAQVQEQERALGAWQTEWTTFPALALATSGALAAVAQIAQGLEVDMERMRTNLELTGGQIMAEALSFALAEKIGRGEAHALMRELSQTAVKDKRPLKEVMLHDLRVKSQLGGLEIEKLFVPLTYQGSAQIFIDRLIMSTQSRGGRRPEPRPPEVRPAEMPRPAEPKASVAERPAATPATPPMPTPAAPTVAASSPTAPSPTAPSPAALPDQEAPGALMDILTRVDQAASEARTAADDDKRSS